MFIPDDGGTQSRGNKTGVVSCRIPFNVKLEAERLCAERGLVLSRVIREFLKESVVRRDPNWWRGETQESNTPLPVTNNGGYHNGYDPL